MNRWMLARKKFSATVIGRMQPTACRSSGTIPTPAAVMSAGFALVISVSLTKILPDEGCANPARMPPSSPTIAFDAGKPDDLASAHFDGDRLETPDSLVVVKADPVDRQRVWRSAAIGQGFRSAPVSRRSGRHPDRCGERRVERSDLALNHGPHELAHWISSYRRAVGDPTRAQHRDPVCNLGDFRELVRDEHNPTAPSRDLSADR